MSSPAAKPSPVALALAMALENMLAQHFARVPSDLAAGRAEYTTVNLPPGMSKRSFHDRCKRLADCGDPRVRKRGRKWAASRDAIDDVPERRRAVTANVYNGPWSEQSALDIAGIRPQRR